MNDEEGKENDKQRYNSKKLSNNLKKYNSEGNSLNDTSKKSEKKLDNILPDIKKYAEERIKSIGCTMSWIKKITLYECQEFFYDKSGIEPDKENKRAYMKPDGGIFFAIIDDKKIPILLIEDKTQGTNDIRFKKGLKPQATGNAIERSAKNINGFDMVCSNYDIFPYVLLGSGCDLHHSETISKRLVMANRGKPNYYIEINNEKKESKIQQELKNILENIDIQKKNNISFAQIFIKAHKFDVMDHGSSMWNENEILDICCKIIDLSIRYIVNYLKLDT